ncbi:hypothetical protein [Sinomonas albida]|uniref:hypothetical protein n=1 Tax=Sinomonas albida TaxID=369942 RepID=UPI0010A8C711|nr:hypothetical protein [Sinomonas albida]
MTILVALILAFIYWPICEQRITDGGQVLTACRRLQASDPPVLAAAVVLLVALGTFFTEVAAFGISLKRQVAEAKASADDARVASGKAEEAAASAQGAERSVAQAEQLVTQLALPQREPAPAKDLEEHIRALAAEYNAIRRDLPSSPQRTTRMTSIVGRMVTAANAQGPEDVDVAPWLGSADQGLRLAAYAFLYTHPVPALTLQLADAAVEEDTRFGQYWALRALRRQVSLDPDSLDLNSRRRLEGLLTKVGPSTDRGYELRQILEIRGT